MKRDNHEPRISLKNTLIYYSMMAPFLILFLLFGLIPVISSVILSLTEFDMVQMPLWIGLDNFKRLFLYDSIFPKVFANTMVFAVVTGPLGFIMSFIVAWFINDFPRKVRLLLTFLFYAPTLSGNTMFMWNFMFSGDAYGLVNSWLMRFGIIPEPIQWMTDANYFMIVIYIVIIWGSMGTGFLSFIAGLQSINKEYYEAGLVDGIKNRFQELFYITLPQMKSFLLFGAVLSISGSFAIGPQISAIVGFPSTDYKADTILTFLTDYGNTRFEMGYASATAVVLFSLMLIFWIVVNKVFKKLGDN